MGTMCNGGVCGGPSAEAIAEMNKKGIYMPKQIAEQIQGDWDTVNKKGSDTVSPPDLQKIVKSTVTGLGQLGGGDKFDQKAYAATLKQKFPNNKEFSQGDVIQLVTQLVQKSDSKEN